MIEQSANLASQRDIPIIKIIVLDKEIQIRVLFSMSCIQVMFDNYEKGDTYKSSFAKSIFHMYKNNEKYSEGVFKEEDFLKIKEEDFLLIINKIIDRHSKLKIEYNKSQIEDVYERFYKANEIIIKNSLEGISKVTSVLSNMPKPKFDIQAITSPLQAMIERINTNNKGLAQQIQATLVQMSKSVEALISSIDFSLLTYGKEWSEQRETLLKYGWFYSYELPDRLINYIHENRESFSIDDVNEIIVNHFRADKCQELKNIVKKWVDLPCFNCRGIVFHEALVNHSRKYFNSSVTLLTIHTEGVITDFVRMSLKTPRFRVGKAIEDIKQEISENIDMSYYEYEVFNDVIERIEETFNENFSCSNPEATSNKSRHKIAHGHAYEKENEVNSLKRFLYLNEIYNLFLTISKDFS